MLSVRRIQNVCPRCNITSSLRSSSRFYSSKSSSLLNTRQFTATLLAQSNKKPAITQRFSTSQSLRQEPVDEKPNESNTTEPIEDIEKIVRDAKQRFRDTLPKNYLNEEEYALYVRLYGPPLRETRPEDVGIDTHADMGPAAPRPSDEGTILRQVEGGDFEEIPYKLPGKEAELEELVELAAEELELSESAAEPVIESSPGYVDVVARNQREYDALQRLSRDFQESQKKQQEADDLAAEEEEAAAEAAEIPYWPPGDDFDPRERESGEARRFHPYTLEGRFHGSPVEILLPKNELITPIVDLLGRTHIDHVKAAAEKAFCGPGLPLSPATPDNQKNGQMQGVGLPADQRHMTEIEADAFLAGFLPPAYASIAATLREVRKRSGGDWLQSKLKDGGLSVLDAGSGGAGLIAWDQIINAEWEIMKEEQKVSGDGPPGKKTVVIGSDRLRHRMKGVLQNTTFLPRLPDYEHSGEMRGQHLDAPEMPQPRKSFDVIIASHLFLQEEQDHYRQAILNNLWSLLKKDGGVLIVLEKAHPRGFEAVAHVRDTVLKQFLLPQSGEPELDPEDFNPAYQREREDGHIIAPCTNHGTCPMYQTAGKSRGRKDYCHFSQRFVRPNFYSEMISSKGHNIQGAVEFSYVAIRRGVPKTNQINGKEATEKAFAGYENSEEKPDMQALPRMVLAPLKRKGHVTLDVCTAEGRIERWTIPKSYSRLGYHDARKSKWGDLWALGAKTRVNRNVRAGRGPDDGGKRAGRAESPRKVDIVMGPGGVTADEKNAGRQRRNKSKRDRKQDLIRGIMQAEKEEEKMLGREMEAEAEADIEQEDRMERRRR